MTTQQRTLTTEEAETIAEAAFRKWNAFSMSSLIGSESPSVVHQKVPNFKNFAAFFKAYDYKLNDISFTILTDASEEIIAEMAKKVTDPGSHLYFSEQMVKRITAGDDSLPKNTASSQKPPKEPTSMPIWKQLWDSMKKRHN